MAANLEMKLKCKIWTISLYFLDVPENPPTTRPLNEPKVHAILCPSLPLDNCPLPLQEQEGSSRDETDAPKRTVGRFRLEKPVEQHPQLIEKVSEKKEVYCCEEKCSSVFEGLEDGCKEEIEKHFAVSTQVDKRNKLLTHIQAQANLGRKTDRFCWKTNYYCLKTFSQASKCSIYIIDDVLKGHKEGVVEYVNGNLGMARFSIPRSKFIVWMRCFLRRFAQSAPDSNVQVLSHWITKTAMFQFYIKETTPPQIAEKTFYEYMKRYFGADRVDKGEPQVRISKFSSHSVCDQCLAFSNARRLGWFFF